MTAATSINIKCKEANNVFARLITKATTFHIKCNQTKNVLTYNKLNEPNSVVSQPHQRFLPPPKKKYTFKRENIPYHNSKTGGGDIRNQTDTGKI